MALLTEGQAVYISLRNYITAREWLTLAVLAFLCVWIVFFSGLAFSLFRKAIKGE